MNFESFNPEVFHREGVGYSLSSPARHMNNTEGTHWESMCKNCGNKFGTHAYVSDECRSPINPDALDEIKSLFKPTITEII